MEPMGAVVARDDVFATVVDAAAPHAIELFHGYTYSGHPAACAAGLATLRIYREDGLFERAAALSDGFLDRMFALADLDVVTGVRGYGMLAAFDVAADGPPGARGYEGVKRLFDAGLLIKWTGDTGIVAPPLICEEDHLDAIAETLRDVLREL